MYVFAPMTTTVAERIDGWSYPPPYHFYDLATDQADREAFLDPASWPDRVFAVHDAGAPDHPQEAARGDGPGERSLAGFFSFTPDADGESVEVGLGMAPERTGSGEGSRFVSAGVAFAQGRYDPGTLTLGVAAFNERAISVYEAVGFERTGTFEQATNGDRHEFVEMRLSLA